METGLYIAKPEFLLSAAANNNNNNNNSINKNNHIKETVDVENSVARREKKRSTSIAPNLSSLTEGVGVGSMEPELLSSSPRNGYFRSSENLCDYASPNLYGERRDSMSDVPKEEKVRFRRKSWHIGKFEKKRRKSMSVLGGGSMNKLNSNHSSGSTSPNAFEKHKRFSWWNIFVPDHWPKSRRRSSTDFGKNPVSEKIPYIRGKSQSVDHGFTSPFDLDSLRSKVEGRFESVDRSKDTDGESRSGSKERLSDKKMQKAPITRTTTYKVEANDTLTSVAARFDTTPSELAILNRLSSRTVFPGQLIRVPDKKGTVRAHKDSAETTSEGGENSSVQDDSSESDNAPRSRILSESDSRSHTEAAEDDVLESLHQASPKPGHAERVNSPTVVVPQRHTRSIERFLKINVRHVTDGQGVVGGVLLVTPNAVMFDPNVSDQLVIEHGPESYGVIAPMEFVVNAAIYHDIAHMRVANQQSSHSETVDRPEIYHSDKDGCNGLYRPKEEQAEDEKPEVKEDGSDNKSITKESDSGDNTNLETPFSPAKRASRPNSRLGNKTECSLAKDEQFPELCCKSSEESSICSGDEERDTGNAFPKAFDKDLITPSYYSKKREFMFKRSDELSEKDDGSNFSDDKHSNSPVPSIGSAGKEAEATDTTIPHLVDAENVIRHLEERRKSSLDHHWAIPNKFRSIEGDMSSHEEAVEHSEDNTSCLTKPSCYDSGIDIRDPSFVPPAPISKTIYSEADILLSDSNEFVPPRPIKKLSKLEDDNVTQKKTSVSFSLEESKEGSLEQSSSKSSSTEETEKQAESKKNKMLKRLSYPLAWMEGITSEKDEKEGSSLPSSAESSHPSHSSSVFSKVFSRRSSVSSFIRQQQNTRSDSTKSAGPRLDYRSMVSVEDMPELFVSFDKLIPRPARSCEDPPLYLRLRMGKPKNRKIPKTTPIMSYGKKKMRPEYWFSVPRNRVDDLYRFLNLWVPHLYGDLDEKIVEERGYELVSSDTEIWDDEDGLSDDKKSQRRNSEDLGDLTQSWEVLSMSDELRRALYANSGTSLDFEFTIPDLNGTSEILTEEHRKQLCKHLPPRAEGYAWTLIFTTSQHGFSLNSMYRSMNKIDSPILIVIQDTDTNVFGALTSCALKVSDYFYGNGESLLYTFTPEFQVYNWTGENFYFFKGNNESLFIGSGNGKFGIWLDGDLYQGRSQPCATYGNEPLVPNEDFIVKTVECWAFL